MSNQTARGHPTETTLEENYGKLPYISPREQQVLFAIGNRTVYGLQIIDIIEKCTDGETKLRIGSLYPALHSLERNKLVSSSWGNESTCGARRRYYRLTDTGKNKINRILANQQRLLQGC